MQIVVLVFLKTRTPPLLLVLLNYMRLFRLLRLLRFLKVLLMNSCRRIAADPVGMACHGTSNLMYIMLPEHQD